MRDQSPWQGSDVSGTFSCMATRRKDETLIEIEGTAAVVYPPPEIDISTAHDFRRCIQLAHFLNPTAVVIDFGGVSFCDSAGLKVLDECVAKGYRVRVRNVPSRLARIMALVGPRLPLVPA